jgi:hypothetical protein
VTPRHGRWYGGRRAAKRAAPITAVALGALAGLLALAAPASPARAGDAGRAAFPESRRVITTDMLRNSGVTRVSDVLFLVDDWMLSTVSGYTWKASPNGLTTWEKQRWVVMIDGQRADVELFDAVNLNMLPIGVDQIDSVVVVTTPGLYKGFFSDAGLIHFHTRAPKRGTGLEAVYSSGNETGDPGPYRFTPNATPNVDKTGPDGSLTFSLAGDAWSLRANATLQTHYFTDFAVKRRTTDVITPPGAAPTIAPAPAATAFGPGPVSADVLGVGIEGDTPALRRVSGSVGMVIHGERGRHEPFFGYSEAVKYFLYSEPVGREIPTDNRYYHLGVNGRIDLAREGGLDYRVQFTSNRLSRQQNKLYADYDWEQHRFLGDVELSHLWPQIRGRLGGGYEIRSIETTNPLEDNPTRLGKLYGSVEIDAGGRAAHDVGAMALFATGSPSLKAYWNLDVELAARHALASRVAFAQRSFAENGDLWYWTSRGYGFLDSVGVDYTIPSEISKSNAFTVDLTWRIRPGGRARAGLAALYRHFTDLYLERRSFEYDPEDCTVSSPTEVVPGNNGQLAGGSLDFVYRMSPRLDTRLHYRYLGTLEGDELFEEAWAAVPDHKVAGQVTYEPVDRFIIWAMLTHYSSAYWKAYDAVDGSQCSGNGVTSTYSARVNAFTTVDVKLRKLLWGPRMTADLIVRNLFDQEVRYHPMGASFALSFFFQLTLKLHRQ